MWRWISRRQDPAEPFSVREVTHGNRAKDLKRDDYEAALDWLELSFREEGGDWVLRRPEFDSLRLEPRFQALWDEVGLPGPEPQAQ